MNPTTGACPVCDAIVTLQSGTEVSEVIPCPECKSQLVVVAIEKNKAELGEAPKVEEDWGE